MPINTNSMKLVGSMTLEDVNRLTEVLSMQLTGKYRIDVRHKVLKRPLSLENLFGLTNVAERLGEQS